MSVIDNPQMPEQAVIQRGLWNWAAPFEPLALDLLLLPTTIEIWTGRRGISSV